MKKLFAVTVETADHDADLMDAFAKHLAFRFACTAYRIIDVVEAVTDKTPEKFITPDEVTAAADNRDYRKPEDWYPPEIVTSAKAAHAEHIRELPNFAKWDQLPVQSQNDWIRIVARTIDAYKKAGGQ